MMEYELIKRHYGDRKAERSGVPLINHINEGLTMLTKMVAGEITKAAFCLHPLVQSNDDLRMSLNFPERLAGADPIALVLAMEYRQRANDWLSDKVSMGLFGPVCSGEPFGGDIFAVRQMLVADKVQNYKDFLRYHENSHPRTWELDVYFTKWLEHLGVTTEDYKWLTESL